MADYLTSQGYKPGTPEFATMLQLASTAVGAAVGGGTGAATALDGMKYNYLSHQQRDQKAQELAACGSNQACTYNTEAKWQTISDNQNVSMAEWAISQAALPPSLIDQLRDTDPSSQAYVTLLNRAVTIIGDSPYLSNRQLINETDGLGLPAMMAPQVYKYPTDSIYQIPPPDYASAGGNALGASGAVTMNLHNGQMYGGVGGSVPVEPGAGFVFGWILNGGSAAYDPAVNTDNFLNGGGGSGAACYLLCIGINHAYGGATAIEIGWGIGVKNKLSGNAGTGAMLSISGEGSGVQQ
ncbi:hypothetical protein ISP15_16110 [Dyella jejuensis]|uniref:Toxin CdiA n=2 Tax=Dyella jejuensis TaxID=1432009 RepID=A0ABW8JL64_9GAMM